MDEQERLGKFLPLMQSLYKSARQELQFEPHVKIVILKDESNMSDPLGKTAHYSPSENKIGLYTQGRHIKDILRSLAHELVHHNQNCRGDFNQGAATVEGYAQEDGHLREMEREAYECGNMIFRDWEDNLKKKGASPLFTSTHYANAIMEKGDGLMKNSLKESTLRNIIRGVIQEMFDEDLNEDDNMGMPADAESQEAAETASEEGEPYEAGVEMEEGMLGTLGGAALGFASPIPGGMALGGALGGGLEDKLKGTAKRNDSLPKKKKKKKKAEIESEVNETDLEEGVGSVIKKAVSAAKPFVKDTAKAFAKSAGEEAISQAKSLGKELPKKVKQKILNKVSDADTSDVESDGDCIKICETYFPKDRSIRQKARTDLNKTLMSKWGYSKKEEK
jgi:hypothetical protein